SARSLSLEAVRAREETLCQRGRSFLQEAVCDSYDAHSGAGPPLTRIGLGYDIGRLGLCLWPSSTMTLVRIRRRKRRANEGKSFGNWRNHHFRHAYSSAASTSKRQNQEERPAGLQRE